MARNGTPLRRYQDKRDFSRTAEPRGSVRRSEAKRIFVVHKHAAHKLHYDFRLELDGVLLSWAVPKGPSADPTVRRLAVHVEDHPVGYADFEGVIPAGEYGGGTVMIWDRGYWEPTGDARKGYRAGRLSFRLAGQRLQGAWSLFRTSSDSDDAKKHWLLVKRKDKAAGTGDIGRKHTRSVVSGRTMEQIRNQADRVWTASGETRMGMPGSPATPPSETPANMPDAQIKPMPTQLIPQKAFSSSRVPEGEEWLYEVKFDGYRIIAFIDHDDIRLVTRNGKDWTAKFSAVRDALHALRVENAVVDGEVMAVTEQGGTSFQALQNALRSKKHHLPLAYFVFDLPYVNGYDLTQTPLERRKQMLQKIVGQAEADDVLQYSSHVSGGGAKGKEFFDFACRKDLEGVVCKKADSIYRQSRTKDWLKVKCFNRQEFVVAGFTDPRRGRTGFGALLLGVYDSDGKLRYCGRVGTGFSHATLAQLHALLRKKELPHPAFADPPREDDVHWTAPDLVAEVEFREWTDEGRLRQPSFKGLREDKPPRAVRRERDAVPAEPQQRPEKKSSGKVIVAGVKLTNPGRILYPEQAMTKQALAEYYEAVAEWILPHVANRPLMLVRCPRGRSQKCFHQKHAGKSMPDAVDSVQVREGKSAQASMICIHDLKGLIALVQLGALEFHPWGSSAENPERPDRMIFDLDPGEGVMWEDIIQAAREFRNILTALELAAFVRTTGGKGLHVVCPLSGDVTWEMLKQFAAAVAREVATAYPERYVASMSKKSRNGRIFIDHFRNARGATAIASYSTRARPGAPVATPLSWSELNASLDREHLTATRLPRRLAALRDDPWSGFRQVKQSLSENALRALRVK